MAVTSEPVDAEDFAGPFVEFGDHVRAPATVLRQFPDLGQVSILRSFRFPRQMQIIAHALIQFLCEKPRSGLGGRFSVRLCHVRDLSQKRDANRHSPRMPYASRVPHNFNRRASGLLEQSVGQHGLRS